MIFIAVEIMGNLTGVLTPVKIIVSLDCTQTINYIYYPTNVLHAPLLKAHYVSWHHGGTITERR